MAEYSFDELYAWLKEQPRALNWGLISVMDEKKLNVLVLQSYIRRFKTSAYLEPITGSIPNGDDRFALNQFTLDWPRLGFAGVQSNDSRAKLYAQVMSGTQLGLRRAGEDWQVREIREITPLQGPELSLDLLLANVPGIVGEEGRLRLDLKESSDFKMNLSDDPGEQRLVGEYFRQKFEKLPDAQRIYPLGQIEAGGNPLLKAKSFALRTQARGRTAEDDEGAVLAMVCYEGDDEGNIPGKDFRYLIPKDKAYDATVLFEPKRILLAQMLEALKRTASNVEFEIVRDDQGRPIGAVAKSGVMEVPEQVIEHKFVTDPNEELGVPQWKMILKLKLFKVSIDMSKLFKVSIQDDLVKITWTVKGVMAVQPQSLDDETGAVAVLLDKFKFDTTEFYSRSEDSFEYDFSCSYVLEDVDGGVLKFESLGMTEVKAPNPVVGSIKPPPYNYEDPDFWWMLFFATDGYVFVILAIAASLLKVILEVEGSDVLSVESVLRKEFEKNFKFTQPLRELIDETVKLNFGNALIGQDQFAPRDIALFGVVNPATTAFAIDPMEHTLVLAGADKKFSTVPAFTEGEIVWTCEPVLDTVMDSQIGTINEKTGVYTPPKDMAPDVAFVRLRVNAQHKVTQFSSSALITVMKSRLQINPLAYVTHAKGTVNMQAGYLGEGANLSWSTPQYGKLSANGKTAVYTAPATFPPLDPEYPDDLAAFTVDEIVLSEAAAKDPGHTALVITENAIKLPMTIKREVDPEAGTVALTAYVNGRPQDPAKIQWDVKYGSGTVDPDTGIYTHDKSSSDQFALITAMFDTQVLGIYGGYVLQTLPPAKLEDAVRGINDFRVQKDQVGAKPKSVKKTIRLGDWLPTNPDLLNWDSITGLSLAAGNTALRRTHATHLSLGQEIEGISGQLELEMSDVVFHFAGYQVSGPQVGISNVAYESARLDMAANLHGGTLVKTEGPYKVLSLSEHDPLQSLELKQQLPAKFKNGALVLDMSKGESMRLAVSDDASEQGQAGAWLRQQLPAEAEKLEYVMVEGLQGQAELELKAAYLGTQADAQGNGDTLVVFASSQYGSEGNFPNAGGGFPRLLPEAPQPEAAVQLISSRLMHRNAFLAGFTQLLEGGRYSHQIEDGRLVKVVTEAGTLRVPPTTYPSSHYTFTGEAFRLEAVGGLEATFELDMATQHWNGECSITFDCLPKGEDVADKYTAQFRLSLHHRFYLLASTEADQSWLEGQFFSPWPEAKEAHVLSGLPVGEENAELRAQAEDFAAYAVKRAILLAFAQKLDPEAPERWMASLAFGAAHKVKPNPADVAFPGALSVSGSLATDAAFFIRDDDVKVLAGGFHEFNVENPGNEELFWTSESLPGGPSNPGRFVDGRYQAPPAHTLQRRSGQVLVMASNAAGQRSVAVVTVLRQALSANPFITVMQAGTERLLHAGALDDASLESTPLKWTMVNHDPDFSGDKVEEAQGRRCRYTAKAADPNKRDTYWLEKFEVELEEPAAKQPVHVLVTLRTPGLVVALADEAKADGSLQFIAYVNGRKVNAKWSLGVGTGQIGEDTGLYEPAQGGAQSPGILVFATFDSGDFGVFEGHQIMPLQANRFTGLSRQMLAPKARSV
ncbi:hypothetical protein ACIP01_08700 [Pseudomonas monteilii]|uniref:hypothetical protein n=1 Tax=Pseudomonas monteilii TaxID=76759 RepID=UPI0037F73CFA